MLNAKKNFEISIKESEQLSYLYSYLKENLVVPLSFDDVLRYQVVSAISAFDKFIHDIIRFGMVEIYTGNRAETSKYLSEPISIEMHKSINSASIPPPESIFEQLILQKHSKNSYQSPENVANGLSLIWNEQHKWEKIAENMGSSSEQVRTKLKLIVNRRNSIVHEADFNPVSGQKSAISAPEANDISDFILRCGTSIYNLVT